MVFKEVTDIKKYFAGIVVFVITSCIYLGQQLHQIDTNSNDIKRYLEHEQKLEARLNELEIIINKELKK